MDTSGVTIDNEDVLDPEFMRRVHNEPLPQVDWSRKMEDSIQACTFSIIRRIENWLRSCRFHPVKATSSRNKNGKRKIVSKTTVLTNIPVSVAGKK